MRVIIQDDYDTMSKWTAYYIKNKIDLNKKENFVLGLPTGSTPLGVYKHLIEFYKKGELSFKNVITFNMDEYVGISPDHKESYHYFMYHNLFNHIDIPKENINLLNGNASDLELECQEYEDKIKKVGGIDLFLCGVGQDGHLAFNEPGSSLQSVTRIKTLAEDTIIANSRFFENYSQVPKQALTVGIKTIMEAKEMIIIISGINKSIALRECIEGPISTMYTCTVAQNHPKSIIVCDDLATNEIKVKTYKYYKNIQKNIDLLGNVVSNGITKYIHSNDKIMILSPHPDDDVIGMGGTMELLPNKKNVKIVYMTNGDGALNNNAKGSRLKEALSSIKVLGYDKENIIDANLPFYYNDNREVSIEDERILSNIIKNEAPNHIFICVDEDPNKTHNKCFDIFKNIIGNKELLKNINKIWYFMGAWGKLGVNNNFKSNISVNLSSETFLKKLLSVEMHISQHPPVVNNYDNRDFVKRVIDNNTINNEINKYKENFFVTNIN